MDMERAIANRVLDQAEEKVVTLVGDRFWYSPKGWKWYGKDVGVYALEQGLVPEGLGRMSVSLGRVLNRCQSSMLFLFILCLCLHLLVMVM